MHRLAVAVRSSLEQNKLNGDLRVVPVEGEPVEAFQLVLPEFVAVPVIHGALQLLPFGCRGPFLDAQNINYYTTSRLIYLHQIFGVRMGLVGKLKMG